MRRTRAGWEERERLLRLQVSREHQGVLLKNLDLPAWALPGDLAEMAFQIWRQAGQDFPGARGERFRRRAELVQALVGRRPLERRARNALAKLVEAKTQWLPISPLGHDLLIRFGVAAPTHERLPIAAVFLSVLHGLLARRLRLCGRCELPFAADPRDVTLCRVCLWAFRKMPGTKRREWMRWTDWLRHLRPERFQETYPDHVSPDQARSSARRDLMNLSLEEWRARWLRPLGAGGRGRRRG